MPRFAHLHTHTHYSLLDGLTKIQPLVDRVKELGMDAVAVTDHGVLYGAVEFYKAAKKAGVKPILGCEVYVAPKTRFDKDPTGDRYYHLILLAENKTGWKNLIKIVTKAQLEGYYYKPRADRDLLREHHEGIIALSACLGGEVDQALLAKDFEKAKKIAKEHEEIFGTGNYFLEIQKHGSIKECEEIWADKIRLSRETGIPLAATQDSHYLHKEDAEYHDVLLAVQTGTKLTDDDRLSLKADDFSITSPEEMAAKFPEVPEAIENTAKIADRCDVDLELGKTLLPDFPKPDGKSANEYLVELIEERLPQRFAPAEQTREIRDRLAYEIDVVSKTGFSDYFLIVQDLINWAKVHGIAVGPGRGSAAGSLVSYVLGITDVNPLAYDLLFERFLNPERIQMPDIDIDFADTRRDEVLDYARRKYGEDHVAQIITFGTMAARAAVRDAGRSMGFSYAFCDQVAKLIPAGPGVNLKDALADVQDLKDFYTQNPDAKRLLDTAKHLEGVVRHASVHACGTVISKDALTEHVPLQLAPQDKANVITQFEMHSVEDLGLLKIDFLGLANLTTIENTVRLVKEQRDIDIDIPKLPMDDKETFELLQRGDTTGVFQFESSGMRRYMKDIRPTEFEDLVALVALYRPGPMELIPSFIKRKHGEEAITYLHPKLEPILKNTYGIGVYQEQMMRIARDLAGYSLAEADTLRKAIGKKIKSLLDEQEAKLISGMIKNGIPQKVAKEIWELFPPFARYGFNKSHAVCYALTGYRTAYLRAHYPIEFMTSLLNGDAGDIERISFLVSEARQAGIEILPPDINKSFVNFVPEGGNIRFGLLAIKNVGRHITEVLIEERIRRGPFKDLADLVTRVQDKDMNKKSLESLLKSGALDGLGVERNQGLENIDDILKFANAQRKMAEEAASSLFGAPAPGSGAKLVLKSASPATSQQRLAWEKELLGFFLSDHPLNAFSEKLKKANVKPINEAKLIKHSQPFVIGGVVSQVKKITTKSGQPMVFATLEDLSSEQMEVIVFNSTLAATQAVWEENKIALVLGKMSERNGEYKMICDKAKVLEA